MQLLIVRHAPAEERAAWAAAGRSDDERPLTADGRARFRRAARALGGGAPPLARVATSPLLRARQTAELLAAAAGGAPVVELAVLSPEGEPAELLAWLRAERRHGRVAVVGHEPGLSRLAGWLLTGEERPLFGLKKGGACLLDLGATPAAGGATLLFLLAARHARRLGRS